MDLATYVSNYVVCLITLQRSHGQVLHRFGAVIFLQRAARSMSTTSEDDTLQLENVVYCIDLHSFCTRTFHRFRPLASTVVPTLKAKCWNYPRFLFAKEATYSCQVGQLRPGDLIGAGVVADVLMRAVCLTPLNADEQVCSNLLRFKLFIGAKRFGQFIFHPRHCGDFN